MVVSTPKPKTPLKGPFTPGGLKTPKGKQTPKAAGAINSGTPKGMKTPSSNTPNVQGKKTPKILSTSPGGKGVNTPSGSKAENPSTPANGKTPKGPNTPAAGKTPKGPNTPATEKTPKGPNTPAAGKTPKGPNTPAAGKTPKGPNTPAAGKTPKGPNTPAAGKTPKGPNTPAAGKTPKGPMTPAAGKTPKGTNTAAAGVKTQGPGNTPKGPNTPAGGKLPKGANKSTGKAASSSPAKGAGVSESRKRSAEEAQLNSETSPVFKSLRIYNFPQEMKDDELLKNLREILEPRGEIAQLKIFSDRRGIQVTYTRAEDARAAKKLNGALMGGRHLTFVHHDDRDLPHTNRVVITDIPSDFDDEDVWRLLGNSGKIASIHVNRNWKTKKPQKCFVTFENDKGMKAALAVKQKDCKGKTVQIRPAHQDSKMFPVDNTVFVNKLKPSVTEEDIRKFFKDLSSLAAVTIVEGQKRYAMVYFENIEEVESALSKSGKKLAGGDVVIERNRKSALYQKAQAAGNAKTNSSSQTQGKKNTSVKEEVVVPAKKLKQNNGQPSVISVEENDSEEDDEDDEDIDGEEEEDDDSEDGDDSEEDDEDDDDDSEDNEQLLKNFKGAMKKLKSNPSSGMDVDGEEEDDDDDDDEEDDDDDDDDEDDDDDDDDDDE